MAKTIEQQVAEAEAKLARLREKSRKKATRQKIIVGSTVIAAALNDRKLAKQMLDLLTKAVTRDVDKADIAPLVQDLQEAISDQAGLV